MMKYSKKKNYWIVSLISILLLLTLSFKIASETSKVLPVSIYYEYDRAIPLKDSLSVLIDNDDYILYDLTCNSVHDERVTGLLSIPKNATAPVPIIILMHGLGDHKGVDYVEYGNAFLLKNGYAVLRIDFKEHGERKRDTYKFDLTGDYKYWTRNVISQTVFDLRRSVDFIETRKELDASRIGYYGISLGGITGTIFCGIEDRIKVPVIALAAGQMNLRFKDDASTGDAKNFVSIIEPINFVKQIAPRPFLMLNAKNDEVIPPVMSKLLFDAAENPKEIIWYDAKHRDAPIDIIYADGLNWFNEHL